MAEVVSTESKGSIPRRVAAALALGAEWGRQPWTDPGPARRSFRRHVAVGDPQASFERYLRILDRHELLGEDGRLREDVSLLSIGDHFDYEGDVARVREDGRLLLRWLAGHPSDQVHILAGNHDICRVAELASMTDERFAQAKTLARRILQLRRDPSTQNEALVERDSFIATFPELPTPKVANRDYGSFTVAQRHLVQDLLLGGRLRLAKIGIDANDRPVLLTHAAVTTNDLDDMDVDATSAPDTIATAIEGRLDRALTRVKSAWGQGDPSTGSGQAPSTGSGQGSGALDLGGIYVPGGRGREGGGMLYHRPAHPRQLDKEKKRAPLAPRRFDPRTLPTGLLQACGHAGHHKCVDDLDEWASPAARAVERGGLRTLRTDGVRVDYEMGILDVPPGEAGLYMIDGEMNRVPVEEYPVLDLAGWKTS